MRVEARTHRRRNRVYELALMAGYINCMSGVILSLMGTPAALVPLLIGFATWTWACKYGRRYNLD